MAIKDDYAANTSTKGKLVITTNSSASLIGNIETQGDHDWFKVSLVAGKAYSFNVKTLTGSLLKHPTLHLHDATGNLLKLENSNFIPKVSGDYYVDIGSKINNETGKYTVTGSKLLDDYDSNTSTTGRVINNTVTGKYDFEGDSDWFKIDLIAGKSYQFVYSVMESFSVRLLDSFGKLVTFVGSGDPRQIYSGSSDFDNIYVTYTARKSGKFFLDVQNKYDDIYSYSFKVYSYTDDFGNTLESASPIILPTATQPTTIAGNTEVLGDADLFSITMTAGTTYKFTVVDEMNYSIRHHIIDATGKSIGSFASSEDENTYFIITAPSTAKYYLAVVDQYDYDSMWFPRDSSYKIQLSELLTINGTPNDDVLNGNASDNVLNGGLGNDTLNGAGGTDILNGDAGNDTLNGGLGNDKLEGGTGDDVLNGGNDDDNLNGSVGNDKLIGGAGNDTLSGGIGHDVLIGGDGDDILRGGNGADWLYGRNGDDELDGGLGTDTLIGGTGDDRYLVDEAADRAVELSSAGEDTVISTTNYILPANVERLILQGKANQGTGNDLNNEITVYSDNATLVGNAGNDELKASGKNSTLIGGIGDDKLDAYWSQGNNILFGGDGNDELKGGRDNDQLDGGNGNDILNGEDGKDKMTGGSGNDTYYVSEKTDIIIETSTLADEIDSVVSEISYTLTPTLENLTLQHAGTKGIGNALNNKMTIDLGGGTFQIGGGCTLIGGAGNDTLNVVGDMWVGHNNVLIGGIGKDTYEISEDSKNNTIQIHKGDSLVNSYDEVIRFGSSTLDLDSKKIAANIAKSNGQDSGNIHSHHINQGMISFDDLDTYTTPLKITESQVADVIRYLQTNIKQQGDTVAFIAGSDTYVFQNGGTADTLVKLVGVMADGLHNTVVAGSIHLV